MYSISSYEVLQDTGRKFHADCASISFCCPTENCAVLTGGTLPTLLQKRI